MTTLKREMEEELAKRQARREQRAADECIHRAEPGYCSNFKCVNSKRKAA